MLQNKLNTQKSDKSELITKVYCSQVKICPVISSEETLSQPEHAAPEVKVTTKGTEMLIESGRFTDDNINAKRQFPQLKNIDVCIPAKEKIASLITPDNLQSEILLSIVNNTEYKKMKHKRELKQINYQYPITENNSLQPLSLMSSHNLCICGDGKQETLSLMEELAMLDNPSVNPSGKIWPGSFKECPVMNMDSGFEEGSSFSDFGCSKLNKSDLAQSRDSGNVTSKNETQSIQALSDNLKEFRYRTAEMRNELIAIRRDFYEEDLRISRLLKEAKTLQRKIEKGRHLDDFINLLTGNPKNLNSDTWPFRICVKNKTGADEPVKMAKKGQTVQFQTELNSDEDWEKFITREGLLIIDVYSEWAGPCSSMAPNLKKIKLEMGGDLLQMAVANNENIEILKRFRGKSEPTWMFVVNGKMVGITFGANAPKLNKFIADEIKKEEACLKGERERITYEFDEFIGEERERWEVEQEKIRAAEAIERAKREKQKLEWRTIVAENCLENFPDYGCAIIFPQCKVEAKPVVVDALQQNGINLFKEELVQITEQMLEEILYFAEMTFLEEEEDMLLKEKSSILLLKPSVSEMSTPVDQVILQAIYGSSMQPPGDPDSPALQFFLPLPPPPKEKKKDEAFEGFGDLPLGLPGLGLLETEEQAPAEEEEAVEEEELGPPVTGVWAPPNGFTRAFIIKNCFPKLYVSIALEEPQPTPPHLAIAFDAFRRREILELVENYPNEVLRYGFFTSEDPDKAELIAKNVRKFEQILAKKVPTYEERLVLQLSKKKSEAVLAFITINPTRVSNNVVDGEEECKKFFPEGYDEPVEEEVVEEEKPKKKKKKKTKEEEAAAAAAPTAEGEAVPEEGEAEGEEGGEEGAIEEGGVEGLPPPTDAPTSEAPPPMVPPPGEAPPVPPPPTEAPPPSEAPPALPAEAPPAPPEAPPAPPEAPPAPAEAPQTPAEAPPAPAAEAPAEEADKATSPMPEA